MFKMKVFNVILVLFLSGILSSCTTQEVDIHLYTDGSLLHSIFQSCFTLRNKHHGSFIYTALKHCNDEVKDNPIWISTPQKLTDDMGHIAAEVKGFDDDLRRFNVTLKGTKYNMYYIMEESEKHQVLGWDAMETPTGHIWTVELLNDNEVKIYQNDYVMCAADKYNSQRINVAGRRGLNSSECIWIVEPCSGNEKYGNALYQSALNDWTVTAELMKACIIKHGCGGYNQVFDHAMQELEQSKDRSVFEVMLQAHVASFDETKSAEYIRCFARNLKQFQQNSLYDTMDEELKLMAEDHLRTLLHLTHKIFQPCVTLRNAHHGSFIYTAVKHNANEVKDNPIWIWVAAKVIDATGYIAVEVKGFEDDLRTFNVTLKGLKYNMYYIMEESEQHQVLGWDAKETPTGHIWTVELLKDNEVRIYQDDYVMCAVEEYNKKRINVAGRRGLNATECAWIVESCGAKRS